MDPRIQNLAREAAVAARALSIHGHDDFNQGQISFRIPGSATFLIKGALVGFDEATPTCFVTAAVDSTECVDRMAPPELPLHQAIYETRRDVNCVIHDHSPAALVFGALDLELAALAHEGAGLHSEVSRFNLTSNTILDIETGRAVANSVGAGIAAFLVNHGSVVVAKSIRHATVYALMLERACRLQLDALSTSRPFSVSSLSDVAMKREYIFADLSVRSYWEHTYRKVARSAPEVKNWEHAGHAIYGDGPVDSKV